MEKIGLLIDSTTWTRKDLSDYDFIKTVQLKVQIDDKTYDEKDVTKEEMLQYIQDGKKFLTSQPSPAEFLDAYDQFHKEGYTHVIAIVLSSKVSGTYQSALVAKAMIDYDMEVEIHAPNSASFGVALGVKLIADEIKNGSAFADVVTRYHKIFKNPTVAFTLGSLKNLINGGRLGKVQAFIGNLLRIKPVIEMIDGKLELVRKERTNIACFDHFTDMIKEYSEKYKKVYLDVIDINMSEWASKMLDFVKTNYKNIEIHFTDYISPVFYSHLGDKGFGIAIVAE